MADDLERVKHPWMANLYPAESVILEQGHDA
jgi:hypothetical protein